MIFREWAAQRFGSCGRADGEQEITCPWCRRQHKAWVNSRTGRGLCFRCGKRFGAAGLVAQVDGISFHEAQRALRDPGNNAIRMSELEAAGPGGNTAVVWPEASAPVLGGTGPVFDLALRYLRTRGLQDDEIVFYGLRVCWAGPFAYRILCPFRGLDGSVQYFGARKIEGLGAPGPKMLYPAGERKGFLFNLDTAAAFDDVTLVEGPFDCFHVGRAAVALGGKTASDQQIRLLREARFRSVTILLDQDAGPDIVSLARALVRHPWDVRIGVLPEGRKDPGESTRAELDEVRARARTVGPDDLVGPVEQILAPWYRASVAQGSR